MPTVHQAKVVRRPITLLGLIRNEIGINCLIHFNEGTTSRCYFLEVGFRDFLFWYQRQEMGQKECASGYAAVIGSGIMALEPSPPHPRDYRLA